MKLGFLKVVGKLPWWVLSKGVLGGAGLVASGIGAIVNGKPLEGAMAISAGVGMIGQRHKQEKDSRKEK